MKKTLTDQTEACGGVPFGTGPGVFRVVGRTVLAFCVDDERVGDIPVGFPSVERAAEACNRLRSAIDHPGTAAAVTLKKKMSRENLRAFIAEELAEELAELAAKRFRQRVGALRRRKGLDACGRMLLELYDAQRASDRAKTRVADRLHYRDYRDMDGSDCPAANYNRSREACENDYIEKGRHLRLAIKLAAAANVNVGGGHDPKRAEAKTVLYFDLPGVGQVSFHSRCQFDVPPYAGEWDGSNDTRRRIHAALDRYIANATRPTCRKAVGH